MSLSQNALNDERIKTNADKERVTNAYKQLIQSRIQVAKVHRDANALYDYNRMLPHYKPTLETSEERLADMNRLKAYLIEELQHDNFTNAQNAIKIVMYVEQATPIYDLRQFAQELPTMKVYMQKKMR